MNKQINHIHVTQEMRTLMFDIRSNLNSFSLTGQPKFFLNAIEQWKQLNALVLVAPTD